MSIGSNLGVKISKPKKMVNLNEYFFGEDQGRYLIEINQQNLKKVEKILEENNVYYEIIGKTQKNYFEIENEMKVEINTLYKINHEWYNNY